MANKIIMLYIGWTWMSLEAIKFPNPHASLLGIVSEMNE